jgi:uncharacterized membrane-anchored protein
VNKVAQVTIAFWVIKIVATTLGETGGDVFTQTLGLGYTGTSIVLVSLLIAALAVQMRSRAFHPSLYWLVVLLTSMAGTTVSDFMDRTLELGYTVGSIILVSLLIVVLIVWRLTEKSLSVSHIETPRSEAFYWAAILCGNTLGTALGDFLADDSGLGFLGSAALIAGCLVVCLVLYRFTQISRVALFWAAFVLTRPFGATFGDLLTKPTDHGGLNLGTIWASAVLAAILVVLVFFASRKHAAETATPA